MLPEIAALHEKLDRIEKTQIEFMREARDKRDPHLTIKAFAALANLSVGTISRMCSRGELRKKNGRIPRTELAKFTS